MNKIEKNNYKLYRFTYEEARKTKLSDIYNDITKNKKFFGTPVFEILVEGGSCVRAELRKEEHANGFKLKLIGKNLNEEIEKPGCFLYTGDETIEKIINYMEGGKNGIDFDA